MLDTSEGARIAHALGSRKAVILRNHGILTAGPTVEAAAWWYIALENACHTQLLAEAAGTPQRIPTTTAWPSRTIRSGVRGARSSLSRACTKGSSKQSRNCSTDGRSTKLRRFVGEIAELVDATPAEHELITRGSESLRRLVAADDWLPAAYATPSPERYQQFLLYADARQRFSVVSFVWGPGKARRSTTTPCWGLIGVLRGAERRAPTAGPPTAR